MGSITGLKRGVFTSVDNSGQIRLGAEINPGTAGQALVSGGPDEPARWDTHTGTIQPLTMGTNLSLASGNPSFNGGVADTINATDTNTQLNLTAALPVVINNLGGLDREVELQYDTNTLGAGGGALEVLKVPNDLTAGTNISFSSGTTYNGSSAITISSTDTDNQLNLTEGNGITITNTGGFNRTIAVNADGTTLSNNVGSGQAGVLKVPNSLTAGTNVSFSSGTTYDGSAAITINSTDTNTTYTGGKNITVDTTPNPDEIDLDDDLTGIDSITFTSTAGSTALTGNNYPSNPTPMTNFDLSSATNVFPLFVGGSEILKSMSFIDNTVQNRVRIFNTANKFVFDGTTNGIGSDTLEVDFTATSSTGYCEFGFYANSITSGMIFYIGIAAATGGTSPFSTALGSGAVSIDAYKLGLLDGSTSYYSLRELLDFTGFENTYLTSKFYFNNLSVGTRYRMALYGRCYNSGSIFIHSGGRSTTGLASGGRSFFQPAFMKFYEYDSSIGGARTTGSGGGGEGG